VTLIGSPVQEIILTSSGFSLYAGGIAAYVYNGAVSQAGMLFLASKAEKNNSKI
jgi:hypothetical protein